MVAIQTINPVVETGYISADVNLPAGSTVLFTTGIHGVIGGESELWVVNYSVDLLTGAAVGEFDLLMTGVGNTFNGPNTATFVDEIATIARTSVDINTIVSLAGIALSLSVFNNIATAGTAKATNTQGGRGTGYSMYRIA